MNEKLIEKILEKYLLLGGQSEVKKEKNTSDFV